MSEAAPDISVVIPAYLGASTISDCLKSVDRATSGRRRQIIVVESSGDEAATIVRSQFRDVELICSPSRLTAGGARNTGAASARGQVIYFTDQDCIVPPDWIDRLAAHLREPSVGAAGGSVGVQDLKNLSGLGVYFLEFLTHFPSGAAPVRDGNFLVGCNSAYKAEALQRVRFPDRTLGEDVVFSHNLSAAGFGIVYDPSVEVKHFNRTGWHEFFRYNREMGKSSAIYHTVVERWWKGLFFRLPALAYLAPAVILPRIAIRLAGSRWSYLVKFLLLSPMCLAGNLVWAHAFRKQVNASRSNQPAA